MNYTRVPVTGSTNLSDKIKQMHVKCLKCQSFNFLYFPAINIAMIFSDILLINNNYKQLYKLQLNMNSLFKQYIF